MSQGQSEPENAASPEIQKVCSCRSCLLAVYAIYFAGQSNDLLACKDKLAEVFSLGPDAPEYHHLRNASRQIGAVLSEQMRTAWHAGLMVGCGVVFGLEEGAKESHAYFDGKDMLYSANVMALHAEAYGKAAKSIAQFREFVSSCAVPGAGGAQ